jgi:pimeloyl-ACP methyl ester carboxylesterase
MAAASGAGLVAAGPPAAAPTEARNTTDEGEPMPSVTSKDGTTIAFERLGAGPPLIVVVGAFNDRSTGAPLAAHLAPHLTVFNYDRRGRGDSGDTAPYAVEREIEDLQALITEAGGAAAVFGYSSGAVLALKAAARGLPITKLALYDTPLLVDDGQPRAPVDHPARLAALIAAGRRGDAVEYFQTNIVGLPAEVVARLRQAPFRPALEAMAPTLVYEATILGDGRVAAQLAAAVAAPTLVIAGEASFPFMTVTARALVAALPHGQARSLEGQTHDIVPAVLAPVLAEFLSPRS